VALIAFIGGYALRDRTSDADDVTPTPSPTPSVVFSVTPVPTAHAYKPVSYTVKLTYDGLSPAMLSIHPGDTVTLVNKTDALFWPASNPHPTHTDCPGFDALRGLANGESYSLTFTRVQTCGYHNHLDPANSTMWGTITVR
jgi:plastocyanin